MTKVELIALAERWQTKADRAMERYQEDGLPRHNREREQAQDLARNVISTARLYGVESELALSRKRADKEV